MFSKRGPCPKKITSVSCMPNKCHDKNERDAQKKINQEQTILVYSSHA